MCVSTTKFHYNKYVITPINSLYPDFTVGL